MASDTDSGDYDAISDPYCYPGTTVLTNIPDLRDPAALAEFEAAVTVQRADEPLPRGWLGVRHYQAIHRHLFQDVFVWAGKFRTVRLSKGDSVFCYPEHIDREMQTLFGTLKEARRFTRLSTVEFATRAAHFLTTLNAIHPFREGNGRTQFAFLDLLSEHAGHSLALERLEPERFLSAMIESFRGNEAPLRDAILALLVA